MLRCMMNRLMAAIIATHVFALRHRCATTQIAHASATSVSESALSEGQTVTVAPDRRAMSAGPFTSGRETIRSSLRNGRSPRFKVRIYGCTLLVLLVTSSARWMAR